MTHHDEKAEEKKEETSGASAVEPIKPGDPRVARRKGSLLDTCYPTSSGNTSTTKK